MQTNVINHKMNCFRKIKNEQIINRIASYLDEKSASILKQYIKNKRQNKKLIKDSLKTYIIDFGKNNEKVKHFIDNTNTLKIYTNIFNIRKDYLFKYSSVLYKNEKIELNKKELYQYLHLSPQNDIFLSDTDGSKLKISKYIIGIHFSINL